MMNNSATKNSNEWTTVGGRRAAPSAFSGGGAGGERRMAPSAFGAAVSSERRMAPSAFGSTGGERRAAPAAFGSGETRVWKEDGGSAFGSRNKGERREAPAAFGGGPEGDQRRQRLQEKAAAARFHAEQAAEERRKAAEEEVLKKKAMDIEDQESYPTLGGPAPSKKAAKKTTTVSIVMDAEKPADTTPGPKRFGNAAKAPEPVSEPVKPAPAKWGAGPSMAQRVAEAAARVDAEAALQRMREEQETARTIANRITTYIPTRTLDDSFDDDPQYRDQNDYVGDEDEEFNAHLYGGRRRGDKGVW